MNDSKGPGKPPDAEENSHDNKTAPCLSSPFFAIGSSSWTDVLPKTQHVDLFRRIDWGSTTLGPISDWGPALRFYVTMVFTDSRAAALYWGPRRIAIYNEPEAELCGGAHPRLLGAPLMDGFPSVYEPVGRIFQQVDETAQTVDVHDILLFPIRRGFVEETYFIGQFIPIRGDHGEIAGVYNTVYESTVQVLYDRRRRVLDEISKIPPDTVEETLTQIVEVLRSNPNDITMVMIYSLDETGGSDTENLNIRGSIGVPEHARCAPRTASLERDRGSLIQCFRKAKETGAEIWLGQTDSSLPEIGELFNEVSWCGHGEAARHVVVAPLNSGEKLLGFYVQGLNPRRPFDQSGERSISDLTTLIAAKWVSSMSIEEASKRELTLQRRLTDRERRLRVMAQFAPVGMCQISHSRSIEWANDEYYRVTGHDMASTASDDIFSVLIPEHRERASRDLDALLEGKPRVVSEFALQRKWSPPGNRDPEVDVHAWILVVCFPTFEDGNRLVMVYVTDISHQKYMQSVESHHAAAALSAKKRQEAFIDTLSHEMRNPLGAMMQLADGISESLNGLEESQRSTGPDCSDDSLEAYRAAIYDNVEASKTILTCLAHQRRIVDDVLILSRLESDMLSITPVVERPTVVVANTVKMFEGEISTNNMQVEVIRDTSWNEIHVDYALFDTTRLSQVLINLISNAIKFTVKQQKKKITLTYGISRQRPLGMHTDVGELKWTSPDENASGHDVLPALKNGEEALYLSFCIQDTGVGMKPAEMDNLFKRFSQASSKTHTVYGGSGLGLYICRQLVRKQGGEVTAASRHGEGSVFGFYIETRRMKAPLSAADNHASQTSQSQLKTGDKEPNLTNPGKTTSNANTAPNEGLSNGHNTIPQIAREASYHVLLVEDNLVNQKIFAKSLKRAGYGVTIANHGEEALDTLEKIGHWKREEASEGKTSNGAIKIVLMDWEMPVMDGLQCCERIRALEAQHPFAGHLPIIAITAYVRQEQIDQAMEAGMDNVLLKPFTANDLLERVHETMAGITQS